MRTLKLMIGVVLAFLLGCGTTYNPGDGSGGGGGALGGDGGSTGTYACDHHGVDSTCSDFPVGTTETDAKASCAGTLLTTSCPATNAVGVCTVNAQRDTYYSDGATPYTTTNAPAICAGLGGVFSAR